MLSKVKKSIYLDYAATTPVDPVVAQTFLDVQSSIFGNPHSRHGFGQAALVELDRARQTVADVVRADPMGVVFTSGATEANNLVLRGVMEGQPLGKKNQLLVLAIEHPSVLEPAQRLKRLGFGVGLLKVDRTGVLVMSQLQANITDDTRLISVMAVNNEMGSIQPIREVGTTIRGINTERSSRGISPIYFHVDATQALLTLPIDLERWGVDFCSISAHKIYGPKGVGALVARTLAPLTPIVSGGPQEHGRRPGTVNVPAIAAFAKAIERIKLDQTEERERLTRLRDETMNLLRARFPDLQWVGQEGDQRVANNLNFYFPEMDANTIAIAMDLEGFAISTGSACASGAEVASHVLRELQLPFSPRSSLRVTLGRQTHMQDLEQFVEALERVVRHHRTLQGSRPVVKS